ncbi:TonB-dependent receptor [Sphingomonas sp. GB1N7]|uniref:TonB-dependent receptor n=1 Tax=Parasphingomonas caseinilytica TaxID=3096158 RepID=UPI002FC67B59
MKASIARALLVTVSASTAIAFAAPAHAQDASAAAAQPAEEAKSTDIIVTARRRDETLQTTPIAITAITTAQLEGKATVNLGDLQGTAPNLLITQQNSGAAAANLAIRGLTYADIEKSQEPTVGVVVDGVFIGTSTGQYLDFFDIAQIEVLRGPQGTLFGRNTIGGVINIQRSRPTGKLGVKAELSYGSFNTLSARAVVNVPLGDTLALKGFYFRTKSDGFYHDAFTGKARGGGTNQNFGASLLFTPSSTFDALLTLEKQVQSADVVNSNIAKTGELFCSFEPANECNRNQTTDLYTVFTSPAASKYSAPAATLEMNATLGAVKLTSITGYRKSTEAQTQDFDGSSADLYYVDRRQKYHQFSQELRAAGKFTDTFDYVVGGYYFESKYTLGQATRLFAFNPTIAPYTFDTNPQIVTGSTKSYAVFGDFDWKFADKFRLSFGGRYTIDRKKLTNAFLTSGPVGNGAATFRKFTPKVGLDYRPNEDAMIYASWSRGYRSGGFSSRAATAATAGTPYQPENVDSYEVGTKLTLLDRKLFLNLAGFVSKYKNLQQNTTIPGGPTGNQTITSNVGSANIKGIEADLTARPAKGLTLRASAGFLDSKFKNFVAGNTIGATILPFDYSLNSPIYSPKASLSGNVEYVLPIEAAKVTFNAGIRHISSYDQQISLGPLTGNLTTGPVIVNGNDPRVRTKPQNLVDASLTSSFDLNGYKVKATVWGRNLTDDRGTTAAFTVAGLWSFASAREPRAGGVTLGFEF